MVDLPVGLSVRVRVPASTANLGPGFDSLGMALGLWDDLEVQVTDRPGLGIDVSGQGASSVPRDASHLVYRSLVRGLRDLKCALPAGLHLTARNAVPHGRGLGSSATAIVSGVVAAHGLVGAVSGSPRVDLERANNLACELEGHPDNASASVYGGMTLSWRAEPGESRAGQTVTVPVALHPELTAVVFVPETTLATHTARSVLPDMVPHRDAARNAARAALLVEAVTRRLDLLLPATRDWLHQEPRRPSFVDSMHLVDILRRSGHAAVISGAGPSVLVLTRCEDAAQVVTPEGLSSWQRIEPGIPGGGAHVVERRG